ncbi:MAG: DNA gyrase modulator, partial [Myxococcota bacterium]
MSSETIQAAEAPFMQGATAIDPERCQTLLSAALEAGGDFADLYFEYRRSTSVSMEDGKVRSVGGGVDSGVGVRVVAGVGVGYAYSESLEMDDMLEAARTAGRIARSGSNHSVEVAVSRREAANVYPVTDAVVDLEGAKRVALLRRADAAARAVSAKIVRVDASLVAVHKEVLVV